MILLNIRPAKPSDIPTLAQLCSKAFFEESLFGVVMHPHRHTYPQDFAIFWHKRFSASFLEQRNRIIVSTITNPNGQEIITGAAVWQRQGDDDGAKKVMYDHVVPRDDEFPRLQSEQNRALDPQYETLLEDTYPFFEHFWHGQVNGIPRANNWYLDLCAVHPDFQSRGVGKALVLWGLENAREENVHASVTVSYENEQFYQRCGFDEVVGDCKDGEGNPMVAAQVKGGSVLFMWAKGVAQSP